MSATLLTGATLVLPDRLLPDADVLMVDGRIAEIGRRLGDSGRGSRHDLTGCHVVPGFVDVHVHGVEGHDVLEGPTALAEIARRLPRYGVTAFCPTSVACPPSELAQMLEGVRRSRLGPQRFAAHVLRAHLESNFINPAYAGAQPIGCLRTARADTGAVSTASSDAAAFSGDEVLDVIGRFSDAVGIVTLAPEIHGGLWLVRRLSEAGHIVSIGHSGATFAEAEAAIEAGVRHATHLFNRMPPLNHRAPGAAGAVLASDRVVAELICDGYHVHPALVGTAIHTKGVDKVVAITDGTAGSGLPAGARARLGSHTILVTERAATLLDGTLAGSVLTMDAAFRMLVEQVGTTLVEAAHLCATTPARHLGWAEAGIIAVGARADLVVLDASLRVQRTYLGGEMWQS